MRHVYWSIRLEMVKGRYSIENLEAGIKEDFRNSAFRAHSSKPLNARILKCPHLPKEPRRGDENLLLRKKHKYPSSSGHLAFGFEGARRIHTEEEEGIA
ncbi:hypothetical protein DUI87_18084 [Hirundo rustica rustica]|uniref:Uncharacterized protein n=1 Tax=Hirundo rustica rustica TaxID=333673 RepID=A0A3M0JVP5_HIRRU|nr:hypothetical protein DUI87_18084 [Hirundo rustica rustica]